MPWTIMSWKDRSPIPDSDVTRAILSLASAGALNAAAAITATALSLANIFNMWDSPFVRAARATDPSFGDRSHRRAGALGLLHEGLYFGWNKSAERTSGIFERRTYDGAARGSRDFGTSFR